uniref:AAA+ ATPase domain-containing protein n=1 Tax=Leersia perrieri TaxID=77586 RepID=A0A0D9XRY0_9ORYZ
MELVTTAMGSLLPRLAELLREKYKLHVGIRDRIRMFSNELKNMHDVLHLMSQMPREQLDTPFRLWGHNVRMLSHDLEDIIDTFLIRLRGSAHPENVDDLEMLMRLMTEMNDLLFSGSMEYGQKFSDAIAKHQLQDVPAKHGVGSYSTVGHATHDLYQKAMSTKLVGIDGPRDEIIEMLSMGDQSKLKIISIFGIGGLGKTTLAKVVYDKHKSGFQYKSFVTVGRSPDFNKVFRNILYYLDMKMFNNSNTVILDGKQLINKLQEYLQDKRYFIVIDDLWDMNSWNTIKYALPDSDYGSKVITTTRIPGVARDLGDVYNLQPLSYGNSKKLLCTRLFDDEGKCLENQSVVATEKVLKQCGGVPLGIITMASLLANKPQDDWPEMYNSICFGNTINDEVEYTKRILSFCYYDMPSHLRTCLLYLSIFREDCEINKCLLIWKWIAEGFIHEEQQIGLFELAEGYFNELINRNMIQPVEDKRTGYVIGCHVHDMVLDLVRSLLTEENFVTVLSDSGEELPLMNANRLALQCRIVEKQHPHLANVDMEQMRSFVAIFSDISVVSPSFQVLRVLALEDCKFIEGYTSNGLEHIGKLLNLRYLGLTRTRGFRRLPEEIGSDLKFLQTLDLYETDLEEVPSSVGLLTQLLCLHVDVGTRVPTGLIGNLTSLQDLWIYPAMKDYSMGATIASQFVKDLGNLRELRVLKTRIHGWDQNMQIALVESLHNFHKIQILELHGESSLGKGVTWEAGFVSSQHLRYLSLACMQLTRLPGWMNSLLFPNLGYLVVNVQFWQEHDMETLGRMPELCTLQLQSCNMRVLNIKNTHGDIHYFQKLRSLMTYHIMIGFDLCSGKLSSGNIGIDAPTVMPSLEYLQFTVHVRFLKDANIGFDKLVSEHLPSLQRVNARIDCSDAHLAEVEEAEAALTYVVNVNPNDPTLEMMRCSEYKMVSSDQDQEVYAITPINSTSSYLGKFGGKNRETQAINSSLGTMRSLLTKLDMLLDPGCRLPTEVKDNMQLLKSDIEEVGTYLEDLAKVEDPHLMAKCWMKEVRELSYDIEDYINNIEYKIKFARAAHLITKTSFVCKINHLKINGVPRRLKWRKNITNMISEFRIYIQEAIERYNRYDLQYCTNPNRYMPVGCVLPTPYEQTGDLVIDGRMNEFIQWLANDGDQKLKVVSIVGSSGIGKTTLAKLFYTKFGGQFDYRAFVQVPQKPDMKRLLCDIISQVQKNNTPYNCMEPDLIDNIRRQLQNKRYLIIIDNLSAASVWDILNQAFPECTQRSRIITTTQIKDVALTCCLRRSEYIFEMRPLEDDYSRKLFFNRLFGSEYHCPLIFKDVSNKIVQICGGLPLAITIMASLLASQPVLSMELCTHICNSLTSYLWTDSTSDGMKQVLNLCYNILPHHLKTCLLYFNMYPEGYIICKDALVKTWVAEGFIGAPKGLDMEKVATSYFDELVGRRLIQPIEIKYNEEVLSCTIHDLPNLLDLIGRMKSAITLGSLDPSTKSSQSNLNNLQDIHLRCSTFPSEHLQRNMEALGFLLGAVGNLKTLVIVSGNYQKDDTVSDTSDATVSWDFFAPPHFLQRFEWLLHDCIFSKVPNWIGELDKLCILRIAVKELVKNGVDILKGLPALTSLSLHVHTMSIEKVIFHKGGFLVLKYLEFTCSAPLLKFESDSMPNLRKLKLGFNALTKHIYGTVPISIEHLSGLKEITAKIKCGGNEELALTSAISNHPGNPKINVQLVDGIFYGDEDEMHTTLAMGLPGQCQKTVSNDSHGVEKCAQPNQVLDNILLESILQFLTTARDRNAVSLVCRHWYHTEAETRRELFIRNCYSVSPSRIIERFHGLRSITIRGRPPFANSTLVPKGWGAYATPWVAALGPSFPHLECIFLKQMTVSDDDLRLIAQSFPRLRELSLISCDKFSATGLAIIAEQCRHLHVLDLINDHIEDTAEKQVDWISMFPWPNTPLESLVLACVDLACNFESLEALVARSPALRRLCVNHHVTIEQLCCLMAVAPNLTHLGTGAFRSRSGYRAGEAPPSVSDLATYFAPFKSLISLSGFHDVNPDYLPAIYPVCANLTSLNIRSASITAEQIAPIIRFCGNLRTFFVCDTIGDDGLCAIAETCLDLRELQVYRLFAGSEYNSSVTDVGLEAISKGCRKLETLIYYCGSMTNAAMIIMSNNCPNLEVFQLSILRTHLPDRITGEPMDDGFGAIVMNCKKLSTLSTSGLVTDKAFAYIGQYGKSIKNLSIAFSSNTDMSLRYVFEGCTQLQELEVRACPFGDKGLLSGLNHFSNMRFLWMSSCRITMRGCREVAQKMPNLVVEVISGHSGNEEVTADNVDHLYLYRSLAGPRDDTPPFVKIL